MKIVIVGAGEVGQHLSEVLADQKYRVTVVDLDTAKMEQVDESHNVRCIAGNGSSAKVLQEAEVENCDVFLAMTSNDETNLVACSVAKALNAKQVIGRIHDQTFIDRDIIDYQDQFGITEMVNPEELCARELARSIRNPGRIAVEAFGRGQIEAQRITIAEKAPWCGLALRDINLKPEVKFGYYKRNGKEDVPHADTQLLPGDVFTVFGPQEKLRELRSKLNPKIGENTVKVVIFGGGETAVALIRLLNNPRFKVRVVEMDEQKCKRLAERFPQVTFLNRDGTSRQFMEEEQIGNVDYFVASTSDDERNVMTCMLAGQLGAQHVQTVINKSDYEGILNAFHSTLKIESIVSPRRVTAQEVLLIMSQKPYNELSEFESKDVQIVEIKVTETSPCANKKLREVPWPKHAVLVAMLHKFKAKVPGADDTICIGDRVVVITRKENIDDLLHLFEA